jgi:hypothetical protein
VRRREFLAFFGSITAAWPLAARAQQAGGMRHVGVLLAFDESDPRPQRWLTSFTKGLAELGCHTDPILKISCGVLHLTSIEFCMAKIPPICRFRFQPNSNSLSTSRQLKLLA